MKWVLISVGVVAVVAAVIFVFNQNSDPTGQIKSSRFDVITEDISGGAKLLDVRTPEEYSESHIDGADNFSLQSIQSGDLPKVDKNETVYVYCRSGNRSAQAAAILTSAGYKVEDLGGMGAVAAMGGKVVDGCC